MIRRTLLEWQSLKYGDGADEIPSIAADRLAAVAAASPLAGREGGGVLEHGRHALRARGVVGVVVADGCALEILPKIDLPNADGVQAHGRIRRRLVHMLSVALDLRLDVGEITGLDWQRETLLEILTRIFTEKLVDAVRQGRPRSYVHEGGDLPVLRGRLVVRRQFTSLVSDPTRIACHYDVLSPDIALNQIMKAAVTRLGRITRNLDNRRRLSELAFAYADVTEIETSTLRWDQVVLDRTNRRWRELLNLARLLLGDRFQTTSLGRSDGFSLLFEMNTLFEEYVARMLARALADDDLQVIAQGGRLYCLETDERHGLFQTKPDILIKQSGAVVQVIDTKWKRIAARIDDPKQGVSQADVYQMMAYGQIYGCGRLTLLYPHHLEIGSSEGIIASHRISGTDHRLETATIDVASPADLFLRLRQLLPLDEAERGSGDKEHERPDVPA